MADTSPPNRGPVGRRLEIARPGQVTSTPGSFATISLESVEDMLEETGLVAPSNPKPASLQGIPPPLGTNPAQYRPPAAAPAQQAPAAKKFRFADLVQQDGTLDIKAVYRIGQVPDPPVSAEQILKALTALPPDLPVQARHMMVKVTATSIITAAKMSLETIVEDARLRHTRLKQYFDGLTEEQGREVNPLRQEIQELEAMLEAKRATLAAKEKAQKPLREECSRYLQGLEEVIEVLTE